MLLDLVVETNTNKNTYIMIDNLFSNLNDKQKEAVTGSLKSTMIIAGAGSGKTKVLTTRIAYLIKNNEIQPSNILAVTFTNKAAREMSERLFKLNIDVKNLWIGTFHGICNKLLRMHHEEANLPKQFYILDSNEQLSFLKRVMRNNQINPKDHNPDYLINSINSLKEKGIRPNQITKKTIDQKIYQLYQNACETEGCVDFAELLLRAYELFQNNSTILSYYQKKFKQILVDEFQDTNELQFKLIQILADENKNVFVVGDFDQSIYSFRGANPENINTFIKMYNPEIIKLEQNYRSYGNILKASNDLIDKNPRTIKKELWTTKNDGDPIFYYRAFNSNVEADFVAKKIMEYRRKQVKFSEMAILYRTNSISRHFENTFNAQKIPFIIYGGFKFFDRQEVKHVMAYLRLAYNKHDNIAFLRVNNIPVRGIGASSIKKLEELSIKNNKSLYDSIELLDAKTKTKLMPFKEKIDSLKKFTNNNKLEQIIEKIIIESGLETMYKLDKQEGPERLDNIYELISAAEEFKKEQPTSTVEDFLAHSVLETDVKTNKTTNEDQVKLMTVHAAKGLEFKIVFIVAVEQGIFPHANSFKEKEKLEEERRLMYVAMTRAQENLFLTDAEERVIIGHKERQSTSQFIHELKKEHIKQIF